MDNEVLITILKIAGTLLVPVVGLLIWYIKENINARRELKKTKEKMQVVIEEVEDLRLQNLVSENLLTLTSAANILNAVNDIFDNTSADRFLLLFAINGKKHFNWVTVFFERHKYEKHDINAVVRYKRIKIDNSYRDMLDYAEKNGLMIIDVEEMPEEAILKQFYMIEGVKHSMIRHLIRYPIDDLNDVVLFSSLATHSSEAFTKKDIVFSKIKYEGVITPAIIEVLGKTKMLQGL